MDKSNIDNAVITVSYSALEHNVQVIKEHLSGKQLVMAVVKANAYGHGDVQIARFLADKVEWFAVNTVEEGIGLREAGILNPILVFGVPEESQVKDYAEHDLTATVSDLSHFELLQQGTDYHINIDTGMGRLGILSDESLGVLRMIEKHNQLNLTGIYTHFATADDPGSEKVKQQVQAFQEVKRKFPADILSHAANSGGIFFYPNTHFDMVRSGIGIYGFAPGETPVKGLIPALALKSKIVQLKTLEEGESVSYGATWTAQQKTNIAVVPVGYEDGVRRNLSDAIKVKISDSLYPIVGTITMNFCMVNLENDQYPINTPVELLNAENLKAKNWADKLETIPYEVLTSLSKNITRKYMD